MRILVVEDEPKTAGFLSKGLGENGFVVDIASRGEDALHLSRSVAFDLIILDVMLPTLDGWSVLSAIRQDGRQTPVLFLTARDAVEDRVHGLELGADDYLVKPFAFSELLARVRSILRRGPNRQPDTVRVADLELTTVCNFYEAAVNEAGVRLTVAAQGQAVAEVNRLLFQRAVNNLVANALAHTPPGGSVTLAATGSETEGVVEVVDTGCGIPATHLPHVFDRFYRVDQARRSGEGAHVGLGLSLVKSIVELHGGTVHISSELERGTKVTLRFPRRVDRLDSTLGVRPAQEKDDEILISASS